MITFFQVYVTGAGPDLRKRAMGQACSLPIDSKGLGDS